MIDLLGVEPVIKRSKVEPYLIGKLCSYLSFLTSAIRHSTTVCLSNGVYFLSQTKARPGALKEHDLFGVDHQETNQQQRCSPFKSRGYRFRNQHGAGKIGLSGDLDRRMTFCPKYRDNRFRIKCILELSGANSYFATG